MTLIELMVGVTLVAIVLMLGMPAMALWMKNSRIRSAAETLQNSFQSARAEAVRRNQVVRIQLVDSANNSCSLGTQGTHWVTNVGAGNNPGGSCGEALDDSTDPRLIQTGVITTATSIQLLASSSVYAFNGMGQQAATKNPTTTPPSALTVQITAKEGSCVKDGGEVRCLNLLASPAGQVRVCDPAVTTAGDALKC